MTGVDSFLTFDDLLCVGTGVVEGKTEAVEVVEAKDSFPFEDTELSTDLELLFRGAEYASLFLYLDTKEFSLFFSDGRSLLESFKDEEERPVFFDELLLLLVCSLFLLLLLLLAASLLAAEKLFFLLLLLLLRVQFSFVRGEALKTTSSSVPFFLFSERVFDASVASLGSLSDVSAAADV